MNLRPAGNAFGGIRRPAPIQGGKRPNSFESSDKSILAITPAAAQGWPILSTMARIRGNSPRRNSWPLAGLKTIWQIRFVHGSCCVWVAWPFWRSAVRWPLRSPSGRKNAVRATAKVDGKGENDIAGVSAATVAATVNGATREAGGVRKIAAATAPAARRDHLPLVLQALPVPRTSRPAAQTVRPLVRQRAWIQLNMRRGS